MKRYHSPRAVALRLLFVALLALPVRELGAQSIQLSSVQVASPSVQLQVQGPTNIYIRVDSSPDLVNWLPVDLYFSSNGAHTTSDSFQPANSARF